MSDQRSSLVSDPARLLAPHTLLVLPLVELVTREDRETELSAVFYHHGSQFVAFC